MAIAVAEAEAAGLVRLAEAAGAAEAVEVGGARLGPVRRETLHETAYGEIRAALTSGRMKMGEAVTLRALAAALGISETPVREAVRRLVTEGALEAVPNRSISVPVMTRAKLEEQRQVRVALEGLATEMAVANLAPADIKRLAAYNDVMAESAKRGDTEAMLAGNSQFHMTLYRASGSALLVDLIELTWLRAGPLLTLAADREKMLKAAEQAHRKLLTALRRNDPAAARAAIAQDIDKAAEAFDAILAGEGA
jgi:DNA-binding GntR family transcriptional regulator